MKLDRITEIQEKLKANKKRFFASDNISEFLEDGDKQVIINRVTDAFEEVLDCLLIDRRNDPNSQDTAR
jgi:GTP cyclohydrolase I